MKGRSFLEGGNTLAEYSVKERNYELDVKEWVAEESEAMIEEPSETRSW